MLGSSEVLLHPPVASLPFSSFIWLLWSIKESAYKYVSRSNPQLIFAPLMFQVSRLTWSVDCYEGTVRYDDLVLHSRSYLVPGEAILSIVDVHADFCRVRWGVRVIGDPNYASQSRQVRTFALGSLARDLPGTNLRIVKSPDGPPEVWENDHVLDIPISLAHHDKYVAWSYCFSANSCA
jgi:hypothetical protein